MTSELAMTAGPLAAFGPLLWHAGLSALAFAATFFVILSIFTQPGDIRVSPQREAALATGHTDRKTVFESPALRPLMWLLLAVTHRLAMPRAKDWLRRTLVAAGSPNYYTPEEYLAIAIFNGLMLGLTFELTTILLSLARGGGGFSLFALLVGLVLGLSLTLLQLQNRASKRIRAISKRVPYSLDLIALAMGAGATFTEAVRTVVREESHDPFNIELRTVLAEMELGTTRRQSLLNLAARVPLDSLRSIISSVVQSEELGSPLADVLHAQATLLRLQRSVRAETKAAVASVHMLVPSILIMLSAVLAVFAPAILRAIRKGLF